MLSLRRAALITAVSVLLGACGKEPAAPAKAPEPPVVRDVPVGAVVSTEMDESAEVSGTVKSRTITTLSSKIVGRIVALHVHEGSLVESGQVLVELEERDIAAQVRRAEAALREAEAALSEADQAMAAAAASRAAAEAQRDLAASTLVRYQRLLDRKSVAPQEYDQVLARQKAAAADVERAIAEAQVVQARRQQALARIEGVKAEIASIQVTQGYAKITAPFAGVITAKQADVGSMAAPGTPLLTLEDNRRYWLEAAVPESQVAAIHLGESLRVLVEDAGLSITAGVSEIVPSADPSTRTTLVRLDLPATPRLRSGLFGRVWVPVGRRQTLQVAHAAIVERGQLQGVYVVGRDSIARFRLVRTGRTNRDATEILSGLTGGEQVVLGATDRVTDGARIEGRK